MSKKLIITEKPSVARDFARVLNVNGKHDGYIENDEYVISWCYGHLVQMVYPEEYDIKYKSWKLNDLPFLPKEYKYGVVESAKNQYTVVNGLLHREDIDTVYWAGDSGKEGQTIEENIRRYGGLRDGMTELRVWIDSQTDDEIKRGINEARPMSDYDLLGRSGIMRTIEDYSLGINFSRVLSIKYGRLINDAAATDNYTAIALGRVMTCVLGMVVNREREIRNFVETPFYKIQGRFADANFAAEWKSVEGTKYFNSPLLYKENGFKKEEDAKGLINELDGKSAIVDSVEIGNSQKKAPLLFNLAELQSECSKIFKISPAQALLAAQDLYEKKLTTYPRTDARVLTTAIAKEISKNLYGLAKYDKYADSVNEIISGKKYVGLNNTIYTDDKKVTDHYAIIPTGYVSGIDRLSPIEKSVYELIVKRFLAIFYPPAKYKTLKLKLQVGNEFFFTSAKVLIDPGYMKISGIPKSKDSGDDDEQDDKCSKEDLIKLCESIKKGDTLSTNSLEIKEGKTSPPKRYTSGNLILAMENAGNLIEDEELREQIKNTGIGTSATRGDILDKLVRIHYLNQNNKTQIITPENLGEMIYEVVDMSVPTLLNPEMTASWEKGLEGIINGTVDDGLYRSKLEDFIRKESEKMINSDISEELKRRIGPFLNKGARGAAARKMLGINCPDCGGELSTTSFGYGCSNYFNSEIKCGFSVGEIAGVSIPEDQFIKLITEGKTDVIRGFKSKSKSAFNAYLKLEKNENGKTTVAFDFDGIEPDVLENVVCPDCGGKILIRSGSYMCENNKRDEEDSCKFFIGKIAGKTLTDAIVTELLTTGKCGTVKGFKSKAGKRFDACLQLTQNDDGKHSVSFDFENVEQKTIKDVACPLCGGDIVKTPFGWGCSNYSKDNPDKSCRFMISAMCGVKFNESQVKELIQNKKIGPIDNFKSKSGKHFTACVAFDYDEENKIKGLKFEFENNDEEIEGITCPKCGGKIIRRFNGYYCANYNEQKTCDFSVGKICGIILPKEQFAKLVTEKQTDKIEGFVGKSGKSFDAVLHLNDEFKIEFEF